MAQTIVTPPIVLYQRAPLLLAGLLGLLVPAGLWALTLPQVRGSLPLPVWLANLAAHLEPVPMQVGAWLSATALLMLAWETMRLLRWRGQLKTAEPARPDGDSWVHHGLQDCWQQRREFGALDDFRKVIQEGQQRYSQLLARRWLPYYVLAFALPLAGFLYGLYNVKVLTTSYPFLDIFRPVVSATAVMLLVALWTVLLQWGGQATLQDWEQEAAQLAQPFWDHMAAQSEGLKPPEPPPPAPQGGPLPAPPSPPPPQPLEPPISGKLSPPDPLPDKKAPERRRRVSIRDKLRESAPTDGEGNAP